LENWGDRPEINDQYSLIPHYELDRWFVNSTTSKAVSKSELDEKGVRGEIRFIFYDAYVKHIRPEKIAHEICGDVSAGKGRGQVFHLTWLVIVDMSIVRPGELHNGVVIFVKKTESKNHIERSFKTLLTSF
jgi:hypothetical protein